MVRYHIPLHLRLSPGFEAARRAVGRPGPGLRGAAERIPAGTGARAQQQTVLQSEDFSYSHSIPAGPYSVVNTGTASLVTAIPLVHPTGPGGTVLDFTIYHTSAGVLYSSAGPLDVAFYNSFGELIQDRTPTGLIYSDTEPMSTHSQQGVFTDEETRGGFGFGLPLHGQCCTGGGRAG